MRCLNLSLGARRRGARIVRRDGRRRRALEQGKDLRAQLLASQPTREALHLAARGVHAKLPQTALVAAADLVLAERRELGAGRAIRGGNRAAGLRGRAAGSLHIAGGGDVAGEQESLDLRRRGLGARRERPEALRKRVGLLIVSWRQGRRGRGSIGRSG